MVAIAAEEVVSRAEVLAADVFDDGFDLGDRVEGEAL